VILCIGTTPALQRTMTFDRIVPDAVNRAIRCRQYASGKSINVARVAHTLGQGVLAGGFLGGLSGRAIREDLDVAGIPHDFVEVSQSTRVCVTAIDGGAGSATELIEEPAEIEAGCYEALLAMVERALARAKVLVLSGSLPPGAPADFYARCVAMAEPRVPVVLDARGPELLAALPRGPSIVKPNRSELGATVGTELADTAAVLRVMRQLLDQGAKSAVVTAGGDAVLCAKGRSAWRIAPPNVRVVSPIGSGDAMAAGLAIGLMQKRDLASAAAYAVACGAANALSNDAGHLDPADVKRLAEQTRAEPI
jgi:tagatose 6-phosphate kinase